MQKIFFTYVWGGNPNRGSPIIFANKANRTMAINSSQIGDLVFAVVSKNPSDPKVQIAEDIKGTVINAWQITHMTATTDDFGIKPTHTWERDESGEYKWPFALQPLRAWVFDTRIKFNAIEGYGPATHTQKAISTIQEVTGPLAGNLRELITRHGREVKVLEPNTAALRGKLKSLTQKHPFAGSEYSVKPNLSAITSVYIATLGKGGRTIKIGHAQNSTERVENFNKYRLSSEKQWILHSSQEIGTVQEAIEVEKKLGTIFASNRTESHNLEIFTNLDADYVLMELGQIK